MKVFLLAALFFMMPLSTHAHEGGHHAPGILPVAPHGGRLQIAEHSKHGNDMTELYFEGKYMAKEKEIKFYPLSLAHDAKEFKALSPKRDFSKVEVKVEDGRTHKIEKVPSTSSEEAITAKYDSSKGANVFFVDVSVEHDKETKTLKKFQIDKE